MFHWSCFGQEFKFVNLGGLPLHHPWWNKTQTLQKSNAWPAECATSLPVELESKDVCRTVTSFRERRTERNAGGINERPFVWNASLACPASLVGSD